MIEIEHVYKSYFNEGNETKVLQDVSFTIKDGEFVAIMGPSGSGKSTMMHILGALDTPTSGKYFLDGKDVSTLSDDELAVIRRQKIGLRVPGIQFVAAHTVLRNVSLPLVYAGVENQSVKREGAQGLSWKLASMSRALSTCQTSFQVGRCSAWQLHVLS